jgi:hypothetical protein
MMADFITIFGSGGEFKVRLDTGTAYDHEPSPDVPEYHEGYGKVIWVDLEEWIRHWRKPLVAYLDILDVRVMNADGTFEEAEASWREEIREMQKGWM